MSPMRIPPPAFPVSMPTLAVEILLKYIQSGSASRQLCPEVVPLAYDLAEAMIAEYQRRIG